MYIVHEQQLFLIYMQSTSDAPLSPESENGQLLHHYLRVDTCDIAYTPQDVTLGIQPTQTLGCGCPTSRLEAVDSQPDAPSLAGSLAHLLFTAEKMATQNATPTRTPGIKLLDDCTRRLPEKIVPSLGTPIHRRTPH